jgi:hypothetical protein
MSIRIIGESRACLRAMRERPSAVAGAYVSKLVLNQRLKLGYAFLAPSGLTATLGAGMAYDPNHGWRTFSVDE